LCTEVVKELGIWIHKCCCLLRLTTHFLLLLLNLHAKRMHRMKMKQPVSIFLNEKTKSFYQTDW
jgi:hypothetical protein